MALGLGIDTGGTYTDAVMVDLSDGEVLESAKALTTRDDLSVGIRDALERILAQNGKKRPRSRIDLVGLSTTLATNAVAEGYGGRVCLMLIGYDRALLEKHGFMGDFSTHNIAHITGGYDLYGNESAVLDEVAVRNVVQGNRDMVEAFGVSSFFGSRNPRQEIRTREIIAEICDLPVTCGHDLTTKLNSVRRAQTVAINASLIPLLSGLIASVQKTLSALSIAAPLLVVRGDGSLIRADVAVRRPVETLLSGPAASMVGAQHLSGKADCWVVDLGGTTTDIGKLAAGRISLNAAGAAIGKRRTMVESADIRTEGLGGDSLVQIGETGKIKLGPKRVVPLCLLAETFPTIRDKLREGAGTFTGSYTGGLFALYWQTPSYELSDPDAALLDRIRREPMPLNFAGREGLILLRRLERLEKLCLVQRAGFTPTDALHALGRMRMWDSEASRLAAVLFADKACRPWEPFCLSVVQKVSEGIAWALVDKIMSDRLGAGNWRKEKATRFFVDNAFRGNPASEIQCRLSLTRPIVAIGAPAGAYLPQTAALLRAEVILPPRAEVANAVGSVVGVVSTRIRIRIAPVDGERKFRAHLPDGVKDFTELEEAVESVKRDLSVSIEKVSRNSGALNPSILMERNDRIVQGIYLDTELLFTATGRPALTL
jgi:N-methylhydantoinase A/oxoprolinase/acetone carboxylase beta subunit